MTRRMAAAAMAIGAATVYVSAGQAPAGTAIIEDLVAGNRILAAMGIVDARGHISVRHPDNPQRYLISRAIAPATVTADDILEFDLENNAQALARALAMGATPNYPRVNPEAALRDNPYDREWELWKSQFAK